MSTLLGSQAVGSSVYLNFRGHKKSFLIVHQGLPSSAYDSSCNGTWLLAKNASVTTIWDSQNNSYGESDIHLSLNSTCLNYFDDNIKNAIKQVNIPYQDGTGASGSVASGAYGLSCKLFLLSAREVGYSSSDFEDFPYFEGSKLSYFYSGTSSSANTRRMQVGYHAPGGGAGTGTFYSWALRSPCTADTKNVWSIGYASGEAETGICTSSYNMIYALILPSNLWVSDDGSVLTNQAPTMPSTITVPSNIMGGTTITVSWDASTDDDGNLEGYIVERSTNGGSSWTQIYQGAGTNTTNTVAFGTDSVMYRVKAYDSEGEESSYRTSSQVPVINNTAPSAPPSISVPSEVKGGGTLVITWSASSDSENNISGYELERSVDGGNFSQIYSGTALTYTDTITKGWNTVAYRVRAKDPYTTSGYTTSATRTVDNNTAPAITCSNTSGSNLGTKTSGFSISYSVSDEDGDAITVTESLDGVVKRTFTATDGASNSFAVTGEYFQKVLNGDHTMVVTATDGKATSTHTLYFTKSVTTAVITLETPMTADDVISICAITVAGSIPSDAEYTVEVTNNANDAEPVWEDCTTESKNGRNYLFSNETATNGFAFNFRVTATRGSSNIAGYITSIQGGFQ